VRTPDRLDRRALEAVQTRKLEALGERLRRNPFFRDRLGSVKGALTIHSLRGIEPVTKEEILADQAEHPPMGRRLGVEPSEVEMVHTTGGTSGRGREIYGLTMRDVANVGMLSSFSYAWAGLRAGEAGAYNVGLSNSSGGNCWISATQAIGRAPVIIAHTGFDERIDLLRRFPPAAMYGTPSAINGLVNTAERRAINLREEIPSLRSIIVTGEPYPVEWARAMEELWGVQLFEAYGLTQSGSSLCAATCECGAAPRVYVVGCTFGNGRSFWR